MMIHAKISVGRLLAATALLGSLAMPGVASAQSNEPLPAKPSEPASTTTPGDDQEIIVTALRGRDRLVQVPAAVTVASAATLAAAGVTKFQDLGNIAPGVQVSRSGSYTQPAIRGVTTTFAGSGQETNVGVYVDGFYQSDQLSINQDFANLENVQILKGPQSVLYGRNATGGAILITTLSPDLYQARGKFSASYARYDDIIAKAYVSVPLVKDMLALSVAGYYRKNHGYFTDANSFSPNVALQSGVNHTAGKYSTPFANNSIRAKLLFKPSDAFSLTLGYNHSFLDDPRSFGYQMVNLANYKRDVTYLNFRPHNKSKGDEFTAVATVDLGSAGTITSHTGYLDKKDDQLYDFDGTASESFVGTQINKRNTFTQAIDYSVQPADSLTILAGLFYYKDKLVVDPGFNYFIGFSFGNRSLGLGRVTDTTYSPFRTTSYSGYLDATLRVGQKLYVTFGGRYNHDKKAVSRFDYYTFDAGFNPPLLRTPDATTGNAEGLFAGSAEASSSAVTPHAVMRYEIDRNASLYASYSRGFKSATINNLFPFNTLKPETVNAFEVGAKIRRGSISAETSAYYYDFKNNQVAALDASTPALSTLIQNVAAGSKIYGIEGSITWRLFQQLNLRLAGAYNHARYRSFTNATNVTFFGGRNQSVIGDWTGRRIARAPDWTGSVGADYTVGLGNAGSLQLSANATLSSRYAPQNSSYQCNVIVVSGAGRCDPAGPNGTAGIGRFEENGYTMVNGQIQWTDRTRHITVAAFVENLTNERYKIIAAGSAYGSYDMYNQPRSFGVRFGYDF